jgi:hypothetical protein
MDLISNGNKHRKANSKSSKQDEKLISTYFQRVLCVFFLKNVSGKQQQQQLH